MSHLVDTMFSVRQMPWWYDMDPEAAARSKILTEEQRPKNWEEFRVASGLTWDPRREVSLRYTYDIDGKKVGENGLYAVEEVEGWNWIERSDNRAVLCNSQDTLELITNTELGDIAEAFRDVDGKLAYETGGGLDGGRQVWALMQVGDYLEIPGDPSPTMRYIALLNQHDGHGSCKIIATNIRIVCANTWHYADTEAEASDHVHRIEHRANWRDHMDTLVADVKASLSGAKKEFDYYANMANELIELPVTREQEERWIEEWAYPTSKEHELHIRSQKNVIRKRETLRTIYESDTMEGIRGTAYGLLQLGGEYLDHHRKLQPRNGRPKREYHLNRTIFSTEEYKRRALNFAIAASKGQL